MQNYDDASQKAMQLAKTPEGQKLIEMLHQAGGTDLKKAMEKAAAGDFSQIQRVLAQIMENPDAQKLLKNMGW